MFLGYDPGGNHNHGVAVLHVQGAVPVGAAVGVVAHAGQVFAWLQAAIGTRRPIAIGIDTLTLLNTGASGWRPADSHLRAAYPSVLNSVTAPNSLYGSMPLNGIAVALLLRAAHPTIDVTETHPKVLYHALSGGAPYEWDAAQTQAVMTAHLLGWLNLNAAQVQGPLQSEHAWDALLSAYAAWCGHSGLWPNDLHALPLGAAHGATVNPIGATHYYWP